MPAATWRVERIERIGADYVGRAKLQQGARIVVGSGIHTPIGDHLPMGAVFVLIQTDVAEHPKAKYLLHVDGVARPEQPTITAAEETETT